MNIGHASHYLKFALRNVKKHKTSTALSLSGLALAFSICLITLLMVWDAMRSDAYLETADELFLLERVMIPPDGSEVRYSNRTNGIFQPFFEGQIEGTETFFRIHRGVAETEGNGEFPHEIDEFLSVDDGFAKAYPLKTLYGDLETALSQERGLVLSKENSIALYGDENPVGKILEINFREKLISFEIGAVVDDLPPSTHLNIGMLSKLNYNDFPDDYCHFYTWSCTGAVLNYALLSKGADVAKVNHEIEAIRAKNQPPYPSGAQVTFELTPVRGLNWNARDTFGPFGPIADKESMAGVGLAAIVLLLSAIINHTVISAAVAKTRGREIAVRKVLGATGGQLKAQYFGESILMAIGAYTISILLAYWFGPYITAMANSEIDLFSGFYTFEIILGFGAASLIGLVAGLYPVFIMGRGEVARQLQTNQSSVAGGSGLTQKVFVLLQVGCGVGLVLATLSIYRQIDYLQNIDKGFQYEGVVHMNIRSLDPKTRQTMQAEIAKINGVEGTTLSHYGPFMNSESNSSFKDEEKGRDYELSFLAVGGNFFDFYDIKPIAGRLLSDDIVMDREGFTKNEGRHTERNMVVNLSAMREIGYTDPIEAIGKPFGNTATFGGNDYFIGNTIVGVVPDINYKGGKNLTRSYYYGIVYDRTRFVSARVSSGNLSGVLGDLEEVWKTFIKDRPFSYSFADEDLARAYTQEKATSYLLLIIASASVLLSVAGLYGLARNTVNSRKREITLRRVLGAENRDVLKLIFRELSSPVIGGLIIGVGASLWWVNSWLSEFQFRNDVGVELIVGLTVMVVLVAGLTTLRQVIKALRLRPAEILRDE